MAIDVQKILERVKAIRLRDPVVINTIDSLIDQTLEEINREYKSGAIAWMKERKPREWIRVLPFEAEVNEAVLKRDIKAVQKVLAEYRALMLTMIREFSLTAGGFAY